MAALLAELAATTPRLRSASCRGQHELFDRTRVRSGQGLHLARAEALAVCAGCPVLEQCRAWLDALPPRQRPRGVIAGRVINVGDMVSA